MDGAGSLFTDKLCPNRQLADYKPRISAVTFLLARKKWVSSIHKTAVAAQSAVSLRLATTSCLRMEPLNDACDYVIYATKLSHSPVRVHIGLRYLLQ